MRGALSSRPVRGNVETVTAVARQRSVDCSRGGELELDRQRDHSVSLWRAGARPGPTASTAAGTDSVLRGVSARQAATSHRLGCSVVALARLLATGPSGGTEPRQRGSDARGERARRDCLWRWIRADGDSLGMHGCPRRSPGRPSGGVRPSALPPPRGGNSLATTIRTALPGRIGDAVARMRTAAHGGAVVVADSLSLPGFGAVVSAVMRATAVAVYEWHVSEGTGSWPRQWSGRSRGARVPMVLCLGLCCEE